MLTFSSITQMPMTFFVPLYYQRHWLAQWPTTNWALWFSEGI